MTGKLNRKVIEKLNQEALYTVAIEDNGLKLAFSAFRDDREYMVFYTRNYAKKVVVLHGTKEGYLCSTEGTAEALTADIVLCCHPGLVSKRYPQLGIPQALRTVKAALEVRAGDGRLWVRLAKQEA